MFLFCLVFAMFCARLFICALWSPAGKGLTSWLSFVVSTVSLSLSHWYPGSGVVLDCIDSCSLHSYLLLFQCACVPLGFCPVRFCPSGFYKLSYTRLKLFPFLGGGSVALGSLCCLWGFCVGLCFVMHFFVSFLVLQSS